VNLDTKEECHMEKQEFLGKNLEDALSKAAQAFQVNKALIHYDILMSQETGLLARLFSKGIKIKAWIETEELDLQSMTRKALEDVFKQPKPLKPRHDNTPHYKPPHDKTPHDKNFEGKPTRFEERSSRDKTSYDKIGEEKNEKNLPEKNPKGRFKDNSKQRNRGRDATPIRFFLEPTSKEPLEPLTPLKPIKSLKPLEEVKETIREDMFEDLHKEAFDLLTDMAKRFGMTFGILEDHIHFKRISKEMVLVVFDDPFFETSFLQSDKLAESFLHIYKRMCYKAFNELFFKVIFDAKDSLANREDKLISLAQKMAERVKKTGRSYSIPSKTSHERKIIHNALENYEGVLTRSVGKGTHRKLIIFPRQSLKPEQRQNLKPEQPNAHPKKKSRPKAFPKTTNSGHV
jgi:predicted RNA-binding protein Jag